MTVARQRRPRDAEIAGGRASWRFPASSLPLPLRGQPSAALRKITQHDAGNFQVVVRATLAEALRDPLAIFRLAVLAHLPFALQPGDGKAEAYDTAQHCLDKILRGIRRQPWRGLVH